MKAIAISPAVIKATGIPLKIFGTSSDSSFSLIVDIKTIARRNPRPHEIPAIKLSIAL